MVDGDSSSCVPIHSIVGDIETRSPAAATPEKKQKLLKIHTVNLPFC